MLNFIFEIIFLSFDTEEQYDEVEEEFEEFEELEGDEDDDEVDEIIPFVVTLDLFVWCWKHTVFCKCNRKIKQQLI